jgi:hypothetical protein
MRSTTRATALGSISDAPDRHLLHVLDQVPGLDLLEHIARRPGHHAGVHGLVVGEARQHQADEVGHGRAQVTAHLDAVSVLEADVQDGDVGLGQGHPGERFGAGSGLPDDLDVGVALEQAPDALTDQLVVIEEEDADAI